MISKILKIYLFLLVFSVSVCPDSIQVSSRSVLAPQARDMEDGFYSVADPDIEARDDLEDDPLYLVTKKDEERRKLIKQKLKEMGVECVDAFHGEMGPPSMKAALASLFNAVAILRDMGSRFRDETGEMYNKTQPMHLRRLVVTKIFDRFIRSGAAITPNHVVVCPYSSTLLTGNALEVFKREILKRKGVEDVVIVSPSAFYKSNGVMANAKGLKILTIPKKSSGEFGKIDPTGLRDFIRALKQSSTGVILLLTMPGNPFIHLYSEEELQAIGRVIIEEDVPTIVDSVFDKIVPDEDWIPLAAVKVQVGDRTCSLFDHVVTVSGTSKSHNATASFGKIGAACTGNLTWIKRLRESLYMTFQRDSIHTALTILRDTPDSFIKGNRDKMIAQQQLADRLIGVINDRFRSGLHGEDAIIHVGPANAKFGPFRCVSLHPELLRRAKITDNMRLMEFFMASGIDCVGASRVGGYMAFVRLNIYNPRIRGNKSPRHIHNLFDRVEAMIQHIVKDHADYPSLMGRIGVEPLSISDLVVRNGASSNGMLRGSS